MEPLAEAAPAEALAEPAGEAGLPLPVGPKVEISARTPGWVLVFWRIWCLVERVMARELEFSSCA